MPAPHDTEQLSHEPHDVQRPSTGHTSVLQALVSARCGHCLPPAAADTRTERKRFDAPPPHVLEHVVHLRHDETTQSTGQARLLHGSVSNLLSHCLPPYMAAILIAFERFL